MAMEKAVRRTQASVARVGAPLTETLDFYAEQIGNFIGWRSGGLSGLRKKPVRAAAIESAFQEVPEDLDIGIGVTDPDAIYDEYKGVPARIDPPATLPSGRREMHVTLPNGVCLKFFERKTIFE